MKTKTAEKMSFAGAAIALAHFFIGRFSACMAADLARSMSRNERKRARHILSH